MGAKHRAPSEPLAPSRPPSHTTVPDQRGGTPNVATTTDSHTGLRVLCYTLAKTTSATQKATGKTIRQATRADTCRRGLMLAQTQPQSSGCNTP